MDQNSPKRSQQESFDEVEIFLSHSAQGSTQDIQKQTEEPRPEQQPSTSKGQADKFDQMLSNSDPSMTLPPTVVAAILNFSESEYQKRNNH